MDAGVTAAGVLAVAVIMADPAISDARRPTNPELNVCAPVGANVENGVMALIGEALISLVTKSKETWLKPNQIASITLSA